MKMKFKKGDKVKVVRKTNKFTNHANRKIGDTFIVSKIEPAHNKEHQQIFSVDYYVFGNDSSDAISNRDLELAKITNWKRRIEIK